MPEESRQLITAKDIFFRRNNKTILDNVSISVHQNDFITIVGPNGAGKTTLLKILLGVVTPDSGKVSVDKNTTVGYVPQTFFPDPVLPIHVKSFLKVSNEVTMDEIAETSQITNCNHLLNNQLSTLSGGELQRVLITRALLKKPHLLCLDEPAKSLDITGQIALYKLIEKIHHEKNCAILMVSHDLHMVMAQTKTVYCIYHHICCSGHTEQVLKDPSFINIFGDDFSNMMSLYHHHHNHSHEDE